jgi:hypothetical protein
MRMIGGFASAKKIALKSRCDGGENDDVKLTLEFFICMMLRAFLLDSYNSGTKACADVKLLNNKTELSCGL